MNDCVNAEFRDQLPALLHERLAGGERDALVAHMAACNDCREELELLRALNAMFVQATPAVTTTSIVAALPAPPRSSGVLQFRARPVRRMDWRIAAAIGLVAVGGSSLALAHRAPSAAQAVAVATPTPGAVMRTAASTQAPAAAIPAGGGAAGQAAPTRVASSQAELSMTGKLDDLSAQQLQALLGEIDDLQATTMTDPEPVVAPVTLTSDGGPAGA